MGLDVSNELFRVFHLSWAGVRYFEDWCSESDLSYPFIGWGARGWDGNCKLGENRKHIRLAIEWCDALEKKFPKIANLGKLLLEKPPKDLRQFLYPDDGGDPPRPLLSEEEWQQRAVAAWYAILRYGVERGDILDYWSM